MSDGLPVSAAAPPVSANPFSVKARIIIVTVSLLSLAAGFAMAIFGDDMAPPPSADANSYSRSALGHRVAIELLEKLDIPVLVSRHDSGNKSRSAILVLAEPEVDSGNSDQITEMLEQARTTIVILPKRTGETDPEKPTWIEESSLVAEARVSDTMRAFVSDAEVVRLAGAEQPTLYNTGTGFVDDVTLPTPSFVSSPQVIRSGEMESVIGVVGDDGIVLGYVERYNLWIISDPDLIANHGIGTGNNAAFWVTLISQLRTDGETVVVDEVIHGLRAKPSIWRALFEFPLALVTLQVVLITGILLWAMTGRFGKPIAASGGLEPGKEFLIDNTANLLHFGGYSTSMLDRYFRDTVIYVRKRLHAPSGFAQLETRRWLDRIATSRGVDDNLEAIEAAVRETGTSSKNQRRVASVARRIHRWKEEMLHGPANRTAN